MANEASVTVSLVVRKYDGAIALIDYRNSPTSFRADIAGNSGPAPGAIQIGTSVTVISLAQVFPAGLCFMFNQSPDYYIEVGTKVTGGDFTPFLELLPGEVFVGRLSRFLGEELTSGAGSLDTGDTLLAAKAIGGSAYLNVMALPR